MPETWTDGYVEGTTYTYGYYKEMCPAHIRFCLAANRISPPPEQDFAYCELGMGQGVSANLHAAANDGCFQGMDFNPDQAAFALDLARRGQSGLTVSNDSFEVFLTRQHPDYDFICLHGGWSWISQANRGRVIEFSKAHLKPGGVFYLSYNCHPGWTTAAPLRALFKLFDDHYGSGPVNEKRIRQALAATEKLLEADPLFCNSSDWIRERFASLRQAEPAYLAHEFFNADWQVDYFRDVARQLAGAKLRFGASAVPQNNIPLFGLTDQAIAFMRQIDDPVVYQQAWDFFCNAQFRTDYFIKGGVALTEDEQRQTLLEQRFVLARSPEDMDFVLNCGMGSFQLDEQVHGLVTRALAEDERAPKTLAWLENELEGQLRFSQILHILIRLVGRGHVLPCQPVRAADLVRSRCAAMNREILRRSTVSDRLGWLASPETGGGLALSREDRQMLAAMSQRSNVVASADTPFAAKTLPLLRSLGISADE